MIKYINSEDFTLTTSLGALCRELLAQYIYSTFLSPFHTLALYAIKYLNQLDFYQH